MKIIAVLVFGLLTILNVSCSNSMPSQQVPEVFISGLLTTFPDATAVEWEENGANYEAEFVLNQIQHEALVNSAGEIVMYKHEVAETDFPTPVMEAINQKYSGMNKDEFSKLFVAGTTYYLVEIDETDKVFSEDGQEQNDIPEWD